MVRMSPGVVELRTSTCVCAYGTLAISSSYLYSVAGQGVASFPGLPRYTEAEEQAKNVFCRSSAPVYYTERKPKNKKKQGRPGDEARQGVLCT